MNSVNTLLMAAARGARVQTIVDIETTCMCFHCGGRNKFSKEERVTFIDGMLLVIHPDDEHLKYGPISTELRVAAEKDVLYLQDSLGVYGCAAVDDYAQDRYELGYCWDTVMNASPLHKSLFLLILSEVIAEDGL